MIGLIFLAAFVVYLLVSLWLIVVAVRSARARGIAGWKFGVPVAIVMYLIVFWDHIPTRLLHDYECRNKAGLVVYKTAEQWRLEHPERARTVAPFKNGLGLFKKADGSLAYWINDTFIHDTQSTENYLLPVRVNVDSIIDARTQEKLIERAWVDSGYSGMLGSGGWGSYKIWMGSDVCDPGGREFTKLEQVFRDMKGPTQ